MPKGIVGTYDHDADFWTLHPLFLKVPAFRELYGRDRSKENTKSSLIMWAFVLVYDTGDDNPFRNIPEDQRKLEISENIIGDAKFDWEKYDNIKDALLPMVTTQPQRSRDAQFKKMHERDKFIENTKYTLDTYSDTGKLIKGTADQLDAMGARTVKFYENLDRIDKLILMDDSKEANKELSESEKGEI